MHICAVFILCSFFWSTLQSIFCLEVDSSANFSGIETEAPRADTERKGSARAHRLDLPHGLCGGRRAASAPCLHFNYEAELHFSPAQTGSALSFRVLGAGVCRHDPLGRNGDRSPARRLHDLRLHRDDLHHLHDDPAHVPADPFVRLLHEPVLLSHCADPARTRHEVVLRRAVFLGFYESELLRVLHLARRTVLHLQHHQERGGEAPFSVCGADPDESPCAVSHRMPHDLRRFADRLPVHVRLLGQKDVAHRLFLRGHRRDPSAAGP